MLFYGFDRNIQVFSNLFSTQLGMAAEKINISLTRGKLLDAFFND